MYLINFATNSNQEYIQKPFKDTRINIDYLEVGHRSNEIETLTARVVEIFFEDVYEGTTGFNVQTLWSEHQLYFQNVLEFTSGKCSFVTNCSEQEINAKFLQIEKEEQQRVLENKSSDKISFSYNYQKIENDYQSLSYIELIENSKVSSKNNFFEWGFETYFPQNGIEYKIENIAETNIKPHPDELVKRGNKWNYPSYFHLLQYTGKPENGSKENIVVDKNHMFSNNMMLLKSDLNNLGQIFSKLKEIPIPEYSRISMQIYKILRTQYVNNKLQNWSSFCFFAAGDDILIAAAVSEVPKVIDVLNELTFEINELIKEFIIDIRVTCATGIIDTVWNVSPKETIPLVNKQLKYAKLNKKGNFISYDNVLYDSADFKRDLVFINHILKKENNLQICYFELKKILDMIKYQAMDVVLAFSEENLQLKPETKVLLQLITTTMTTNRAINFINLLILMSNSREPEIFTRSIYKKRVHPIFYAITKKHGKDVDEIYIKIDRIIRLKLKELYFDVINSGKNSGLFHDNSLYYNAKLSSYVMEKLQFEYCNSITIDMHVFNVYIEEIVIEIELEILEEMITDYALLTDINKIENDFSYFFVEAIKKNNNILNLIRIDSYKVFRTSTFNIVLSIYGKKINTRKNVKYEFEFEYEHYSFYIIQIHIMCVRFKLDYELIESKLFKVISKSDNINNFINVTKQEMIENIYLLDLKYYKSDNMSKINDFLDIYCSSSENEQRNIITALSKLEEICNQMVIKSKQ